MGTRYPSAALRMGALTALISAVLVPTGGDPALASDFTLHVPVLMYHRITEAPKDASHPSLWVAPSRFRRQLAALRARGWRTITAEELALAVRDHRAVGYKRFVITFDDGARDGYRNAAPILADLGMHATYCVTPGRASRPWQLSFEHMRILSAAGHEIANHSLSHADLPSLAGDALRRQVRRARQLIAERVGEAPRAFCYPYGHHDRAVRRVVGRSGHLLAFTTVYGARESTATPMRSPRIRVNGYDRPAELVARLRPYASGGGRLIELSASVASPGGSSSTRPWHL